MSKINSGLSAWAGVMGAFGVAAAAVAAHLAGAEKLGSVALILLTHAAALLALTQRNGKIFLAAAGIMAFGATLFALEVSLATLRGAHLFPLAAPTGGLSLIFAWLMVFFASLAPSGGKQSGTLP